MKDLIERLRAQASAHRYMDEPDSAKLLDEAVAALEEATKKPPKPALAFDNPLVQRVYEVLTDERNPPEGEHWEGFAARRIVETLLHGDDKGWHAPGLGEVHAADHSGMLYCANADDVADDNLARRVCLALNNLTDTSGADAVLLDFMSKESYHFIQLAGTWYSRKHHGAPWLRQPDLRTAIRTVMAMHEREVSPKASQHAPSASPGWTHLHKVLPVLRMAANGLWGWPANSRCKYIDLRIDMRDGNCILYDRYHEVTSPEEFAHQSYSGAGWRWPEQATLSLQANIEADRQYLTELAAHFDGSPVPEIKAYSQRLITIADKLV